MKAGDEVWHKVFEIGGIVVHATSNLAYVRWSNGETTECNLKSLALRRNGEP